MTAVTTITYFSRVCLFLKRVQEASGHMIPFHPYGSEEPCQHSRTVETAHSIGFSLSVPKTACFIPNEWTASASNECPPSGRNEVKERSEVTRDGNSSSGKVEYVGLSAYFNPSVSAVLCGSQSV